MQTLRPRVSTYVASKWAVDGLVQTMQRELEGTGVRASIVRPGPTNTEMGNDWPQDETVAVLETWVKWGLARHPHFLRAQSIADAVHTIVSAPRGTHIQALDVQPEAPLDGSAGKRAERDEMTETIASSQAQPKLVTQKFPDDPNGHLEELRTDPIGLLERVRAECGDVGRFRLVDNDVVLVTGAEANEVYFRADDEVLDQAEAYPFMTPVFGKGVVFDTTPEQRREGLRNQALRGDHMKGHAATIEREVRRMVAGWGDEGSIDLLDWFAELTIYTTSACLIGQRFREELDGRFAELYHDLEKGTDAIAYVDPYADIESFRKRDAARLQLVELVQGIMDRRQAEGDGSARGARPARHPDDDQGRGRRAEVHRRPGDRDVHLDDVRRPPHDVRHLVVDPDRAAAPPRGHEGRRRRARRPLRRRVRRSRSRRSARSRDSRPRSRRRCGCTRR